MTTTSLPAILPEQCRGCGGDVLQIVDEHHPQQRFYVNPTPQQLVVARYWTIGRFAGPGGQELRGRLATVYVPHCCPTKDGASTGITADRKSP